MRARFLPVMICVALVVSACSTVQEESPVPADAPTTNALLGMAYTLVFPTIVAYFLNAYALARVSASKDERHDGSHHRHLST